MASLSPSWALCGALQDTYGTASLPTHPQLAGRLISPLLSYTAVRRTVRSRLHPTPSHQGVWGQQYTGTYARGAGGSRATPARSPARAARKLGLVRYLHQPRLSNGQERMRASITRYPHYLRNQYHTGTKAMCPSPAMMRCTSPLAHSTTNAPSTTLTVQSRPRTIKPPYSTTVEG